LREDPVETLEAGAKAEAVARRERAATNFMIRGILKELAVAKKVRTNVHRQSLHQKRKVEDVMILYCSTIVRKIRFFIFLPKFKLMKDE
jgi:hypothetical protein